MHTIEKGDITLAMVTARMLQKGWIVLKPVSELSRYDLVIDRGEGFERVQCKTGRLQDGVVKFSACSVDPHSQTRRSYVGEIESFGVYCSEIDQCYFVPVADAGNTQGSLRVAKAKNGQTKNVRLAADYAI